MVNSNQEAICLLIKESGGSVYQRHRLNIGLYALSMGCIEKDFNWIFTYNFEEPSYAGMADSQLDEDMLALQDFGYIEVDRVKLPHYRTTHDMIRLMEKGKKAAKDIGLTSEQLNAVKEVAQDLSNLENTAEDLLRKYGHNWCAKMNKELFGGKSIA